MGERVTKIFDKVIAIFVVVAAWEILPRLGLVDNFIIPPFSDVVENFIKLSLSGELFFHLWASVQRSVLGFLLASFVAIPLGIAMGWFNRVERILDPLFQIFRNMSVLSMFPVFILVFGLGETSKVAIIFWGSFWPTLLNTIDGVKNVEPLLIKAAKSMGVSDLALFWKVIFPAIIPSILTGVRLSAGVAIIILVAAEMVGANQGIGFYIFYAEQRYEVAQMYAGIITIGLFGLLVNYILVKIEKYLTSWKEQAIH